MKQEVTCSKCKQVYIREYKEDKEKDRICESCEVLDSSTQWSWLPELPHSSPP
jgi:hypothetical protein